MKRRLIPCLNCERHVRSNEVACPFCKVALPEAAPPRAVDLVATAASPPGLSRAAVFALRTALVAAVAPGALACGGDEGTQEREPRQDVVAAAGAGAAASGGGASGRGGAAQGGSSAGTTGGVEIAIDDPQTGVADAGVDAAVVRGPVPIYGGVFPDPVSRARV